MPVAAKQGADRARLSGFKLHALSFCVADPESTSQPNDPVGHATTPSAFPQPVFLLVPSPAFPAFPKTS